MVSEEMMTVVEEEGHDDWLSLDDIEGVVASVRGTDEVPMEVTQEAVAVAAAMVRAGRLVPGYLKKRLEPWPLSREDAAQRIENEAAALLAEKGWLGLGMICWFTLPQYVSDASEGS